MKKLEYDDIIMHASATNSFYFTRAACIIPMFTGTISFFSSALIIYIAYKSKMNTTYHRIMVFMSFWDMVTSFYLALSTTPMPKETIYPFQGPMYGNVHLCMAQAFLVLWGFGISIFSNMFLALYYLCTIRYNVDEATMTKRLEPGFLVLSVAMSLVLPVFFAKHDYLNPTPNEAFCAVGPYPFDCDGSDIPCERGKPMPPATYTFMEIYAISVIGVQFITIFFSMFLIIHTFYTSERDLNKNQSAERLESVRSMTRTIVRQALMYICASLLTWSWTVITFFVDPKPVVLGTAIFTPLQGFFNAAIFVYHKVDNVQRARNYDLSFYEAFKVVLKDPDKVADVYISRIGMISELQSHHFNRNDRLCHHLDMSTNESTTGLSRLALHQSSFSSRSNRHAQSLCFHSFPSEPSSDPSGALSSAYIPDQNEDNGIGHTRKTQNTILAGDAAKKTYYQNVRENIQSFTIVTRNSYLPIETGRSKEERCRNGNVDRISANSELSTIVEEKGAPDLP